MNNELGKLLKELRGPIRSYRTISELANNEISHSQIKLIENGSIPKPKSLKILADVYNYSYDKLMELAGYSEENNDKVEKLFEEYSKLTKEERDKFLQLINLK